jgi:hypothetical protein
MPKIHNLDEGVKESYEFIVLGHKYRYTHMTTEQSEEIAELKKIDEQDEEDGKLEKDQNGKFIKKSDQYLYQFIAPVDEKSPLFSETAGKMTQPHWHRFTKMLEEEAKS